MILADKIISLRKKAGWSQEELASQLGVTRQSVSKWEGAQSVPDMDKVVQMSRLFGVSTDYLLKDELEEAGIASVPSDDRAPLRRVTMEQAARYLALRREAAPRLALATFLCVVSPVCLLMLAAMSELQRFSISENAAAGIGLCVLLALVAAGVSIFLAQAAKVKEFEFLEKEPFETEYGVSGMVRERRRGYQDTHTRRSIIATVLCILSAVPLFVVGSFDTADVCYVAAVCALLLIVGVGAAIFVLTGTLTGAMDQLLEEGDYTRCSKARSGVRGTISVIYWLVVTAIFLFYTFGPMGNGQAEYSWFIWAIGGVLYAAVMGVVSLLQRGRSGR